MDAPEIRRLFASVPAERQILTVNGLNYDYVHYRHNQAGTAELINNNHRFTPFAKRLEEDGKIEVQIRCWEFNIDMIEVLDETTGKYHPMWSTDPDYTGGLSRWEHKQYYNLLKLSDRGSARQRGRVSAKAKSTKLKGFDDEIYKLGMRDRQKSFALIEAEEKRRQEVEAARLRAENNAGSDEHPVTWLASPGGESRNDVPTPPPQKRDKSNTRKQRDHTPPSRPADYGTASTADVTRPINLTDNEGNSPAQPKNWKFRPRRPKNG